jgi:hypothetical protein
VIKADQLALTCRRKALPMLVCEVIELRPAIAQAGAGIDCDVVI